MKRFLAFAGDNHYPLGGMKDFKGSFDSRLEATNYLIDLGESFDWYQIYDSLEGIYYGKGGKTIQVGT